MLCCHVTFIGDPSCGFYLTTSMSARYPLASFDAVRDGCSWVYDFHNTSTISFDGVTPNGTNDPCETAHWDFGDGTTSDQYNPRHEFPGPGSYTVTLVSGLSHDECLDTSTMVIDLLGNYPVIHGDFDICGGQGTTLSATGGHHYVWLENGTQISTESSVFVRPEATTTYTLQSFGADSCEWLRYFPLLNQLLRLKSVKVSLILKMDSTCLRRCWREHSPRVVWFRTNMAATVRLILRLL